ncbi:MAG: sugar phosphate isomerase/epimerase family protein [Candidatus Freyarchaeota archaeon]
MATIGLSSTQFLNLSLNRIVEKLANYGYSSIEIWADVPQKWSGNYSEREQRELRETLESFGFESSVHAPIWDINLASHIAGFRRVSIEQVKWSIDLARNLGSRLVTLHPGHMPPYPFISSLRESGKKNFLDSLQTLLDYSAETGVPIGLENLPLGLSFCYTLDELIDYVNSFENLRVTLDVPHAYVIGKFLQLIDKKKAATPPEDEIAEAIRKLGNRIINIHLHDNDGSWDQHKVPGEGTIDFKPIVEAMKEINYNHLITLEIWGSKDPDKTAMRAINVVKELLNL